MKEKMMKEKNERTKSWKKKTKRRKRKIEQKRRRRKKRREKKGTIFFCKERWASENIKKIPTQCLVWLGLNGLGSSQNDQNSLIHSWVHWWVLVHSNCQIKQQNTEPNWSVQTLTLDDHIIKNIIKF
jgi:hypothetical protein